MIEEEANGSSGCTTGVLFRVRGLSKVWRVVGGEVEINSWGSYTHYRAKCGP
jgi:hypothetical protein